MSGRRKVLGWMRPSYLRDLFSGNDTTDLRRSVDLVLYSYLGFVCAGLAIFYVALTLSHYMFVAPGLAGRMEIVAGASAIVLALAGWSVARGWIPVSAAHPLAFAVGCVGLINSLAHIAVTGELQHTSNVIILLITAGALLLSLPWLALLQAVAAVGWVGCVSILPDTTAWVHWTFAIGIAVVISHLIRYVRLRTQRQLWSLQGEHRRDTHEIAARAAREAAILEAALDCIITIDAEGKVVEFNPAAERTFGYRRDETVGESLAELIVPPSLRTAHIEGMKRYLATGDGPVLGKRIEITAMRKGGEEFPVELAVTPVWAGDTQLFSAYVRDITDRHRAQAELAEALRKAEAASEAKSRFLATMSHEIRTPLNPVIGLTGVLLESDLSPEQRKSVVRIRQSGRLLLRRINDLLDFSRIEAGRIELEESDFDPREAVRQVVDLFTQQAARKGLLVTEAVDPAVPLKVHGDVGRLQQILSNLVSNAVKFTDRGRVVVRVSRDPSPGRVILRFVVEDSGIGIRDEDRAGLFEAFVQLDSSTTRRHEGSGLGLAIAAELTQLLGGEIGVESMPAKGSRFWFTACFDEAAETESLPEEVESEPAVPVAETRHASILVAEDNSINQEVISLLVRRLGHTVDVVGDGREAVTAAASGRYDLILMDCQMPDLDGMGATREIRAAEPSGTRIPIIAMTAYAGEESRRMCLAAGMDDFVSKPVEVAALGRVLDRYLGQMASVEAPATLAAAKVDVDLSVIESLRELESPGHPSLVADLVARFAAGAPKRVQAIAVAVNGGDLETVARQAHDLKSESGNLGAMRVCELASALQDAARAGESARSAALAAVLPNAVQRACEELQRVASS